MKALLLSVAFSASVVTALSQSSNAVHQWLQEAEQNDADAQYHLGRYYHDKREHAYGRLFDTAQSTNKDYVEAVKWWRKAAEQHHAEAEHDMGRCYEYGQGVAKDYAEALKWFRRAAEHGFEDRLAIACIEYELNPGPSNPGPGIPIKSDVPPIAGSQGSANLTGTGFFITDDGYLITNAHVAGRGAQVRLVTETGTVPAKIVTLDSANDVVLLKAEGRFSSLPVVSSRSVRMGSTVATVGFPNPQLQGFTPKLAKGEIASLSGAGDDPRYFQISVPLQPGNSGGALVDEHGNVVGVVAAKLSAQAALGATGSLPENVNYAVKSSYILNLLESAPGVSGKIKEPNTNESKFEDVVHSAQKAAALVLVY